MSWNEDLEGTALEIAATDDSPLCVMAGPGTGKSFALKRRVARLLEEGQEPERILVVTFTRTAAAGLKQDLRELGVDRCDQVRVSTLHSFCFSLLSRHEVFDTMGRFPRPVVTFRKSAVQQFEGRAMLDDIVLAGDFGSKRDCSRRVQAFEAAWARLQSDSPGWPQDVTDQQFQDALISWLKFHRAMLVGELVPEALRFLRSNPSSDALGAFDHVIVDEYQDLNKAEQQLLELLASQGSMAVAGDADQSIYSFRYANPQGIDSYTQQHPHTHPETLEECRRCPALVVRMANDLIQHNHVNAQPHRLLPGVGNPAGEVHIVQWANVDAETRGIAHYVESLRQRGYLPGEILILTPRRLLGYEIRDYLRAASVPVHSFYHEEALESERAQRAFALLSLLANVDDRVALRWWLGQGSTDSRGPAYQQVRRYCEQNDVSPREALEAMACGTLVLPNATRLLRQYRELIGILGELRDMTLNQLADKLLPIDDEECAELREIALLALPAVQDAQGLLERLRVYVTQPETPEGADYVRVMSLHKSKGLTARVVIVTSCVEGLVPGRETDQPSDGEREAALQEQRRLFYVAITRTKEILVLSSAVYFAPSMARRLGVRLTSGGASMASRFIDELGPDAPIAVRGDHWQARGYTQ
ncbi:MAG TPA: ATP-dependent helicase [Candidatus Deferrimicrobium sp.]|nr:ATP-dependent helicase [Candidatus Deferrimicrobium sp.]